ncbi:MAG TPA: hypothetical protein VEO53_15480, partial [Candidatus Binatia bacterium]|nr:hypothetical protein [Candidatus Binatia bacterium]
RAADEGRASVALARNPRLRLYTVPKLKADEPLKNIEGAWQECSPGSASNFSAVAYYFGNFLQKDLGVPVGLIHTSWGGSPAEVWIGEQTLASNPDYKRDILDAFPEQAKRFEEAVAQFEKEQAEAKREGKSFDKRRPWGIWKPSELYNGMIAPLIPYAIKGAIWYQGESNAGRAYQYRTLFPDLITNWRPSWRSRPNRQRALGPNYAKPNSTPPRPCQKWVSPSSPISAIRRTFTRAGRARWVIGWPSRPAPSPTERRSPFRGRPIAA